jgi:hypothetical protein
VAQRSGAVRLLVTVGDRLCPTHVALIVMLLEELTGQDTEILRNWRLAERRRLLKASSTITLGPLRFRPITKPMDVREYRASDPLRIPDLHQPVFP